MCRSASPVADFEGRAGVSQATPLSHQSACKGSLAGTRARQSSSYFGRIRHGEDIACVPGAAYHWPTCCHRRTTVSRACRTPPNATPEPIGPSVRAFIAHRDPTPCRSVPDDGDPGRLDASAVRGARTPGCNAHLAAPCCRRAWQIDGVQH